MMIEKAPKSPSPRRYPIPAEQWDLPVSFDDAGKPVTLRQFVEPGRGAVLSLTALSPEMQAELTVRRIEAQPVFELAMVGAGLVDKVRAIAEVRAHSRLGLMLTEIEQRTIRSLVEAAAAV